MISKKSLSKLTQTTKGTVEQGALKQIHRGYNKLNGYEAMLSIINRYRFVLYPFIFLSIMGSSYSFFYDLSKAFSMLHNSINIIIAIFLSSMLEVVRDGSIIAVFNSKMKLPSRLLVSTIFVVVTVYMYSSHLKAINIISEKAIKHTLTHQNENEIKAVNPQYEITLRELKALQYSLLAKEAEKTPELMANVSSIYKSKREDTIKRITIIEKKIEDIKSKIEAKNREILNLKNQNIQKVKQEQQKINNILLATFLLIESLAMLGAVIKFIHSNNAKKEITKHSEIIEDYIEVSEQMKQDNEALVKNLSNILNGQMEIFNKDMKQTNELNVQFLQAMAQNKINIQREINQALQSIFQMQTIQQVQQPTPTIKQVLEEPEQKSTHKIGFKPESEKLIMALFHNGQVGVGEKLASKTNIIDVNNRSEDKQYKQMLKKLVNNNIVEYKKGFGYYALGKLDQALQVL